MPLDDDEDTELHDDPAPRRTSVDVWEPTVRWIWSQVKLSPSTPFDVR